MPDSPYSGGFNLAVLPQYNPQPGSSFVVNKGAVLQGVGQGLDLGAQIATTAPLIQAKIAQAKLQNAQDSAQLDNVHALADAQLAKAKYDKSLANLGSQRNDYQADALDRAHNILQGVVATTGALGASPNIAAPNPADASGSPQQTTPALNIVAPQNPGAFQGGPQGLVLPGGGIGNIAVSGATTTPSTAGTNSAPQQFQVAATPPPAQQQPNSYGLAPAQIQRLTSIMTPDQALELAQNIRAAQTPAGQAQIAKLYADVAETAGRGDYYRSFAALKNAQANNLTTTGGRYGLNSIIAQNMKAQGIDLNKAYDLDGYQEAVQEAATSGLPPPELSDFVNPEGLAAEQARVNGLKNKALDIKKEAADAATLRAQNTGVGAVSALLGGTPTAAPPAGTAPVAPSAPGAQTNAAADYWKALQQNLK